ncbi:MAG: 30S ribosomal protein S3 [Candidatus Njordarchaeales archaeon]
MSTISGGSVQSRIIKQMLLKLRIDEYLRKRLPPIAGYVGIEYTPTSIGQRIIVYARNPKMIVGRKGRRSRDLTREIKEKFNLANPQIEVKRINKPELNAQLMAEEIARGLERGIPVRRMAYSVMNRIMAENAEGVEIRIGGKLTKRRSRRYRFAVGTLIHSGEPAEKYIDVGKAAALTKTGIIGVKVSIVKSDIKLPDRFNILPLSNVEGKIERLKTEIEKMAEELVKEREEEENDAETE